MTDLQRQRIVSHITTQLERYELQCAACDGFIWPESGPFTVVIEPDGAYAAYGACGVPADMGTVDCEVWNNGGSR